MFIAIAKRHGIEKLKQVVATAKTEMGKFANDRKCLRWLEASVSFIFHKVLSF